MLRLRRFVGGATLVILLSGCILGGDCDGPDVPEPAACEGSVDEEATVDALAIGSGEPFRPLEDGDPTQLEVGGQGLTMLTLDVGWQADVAPACAKVKLRVLRLDGSELASQEREVTSYDAAPWRVSPTFYFVIDYDWGERVRVEGEAFGRMVSREVRVGGWPPDAGVSDGGALDAGEDAGAGSEDAGSIDDGDAGSIDGGSIDGGSIDAGT